MPWKGIVRATAYGFLFAAALLRVTPWPPFLSLLLLGIMIALLLPRTLYAGLLSLALGTVMFSLADTWYPGFFASGQHYLALLFAPGCTLATSALLRRIRLKHLAYGLMVILCVIFLIQGFQALPSMDRQVGGEPRAETYNYDPFFFLKTFYLVEHGEGYYQAYGQAIADDARFTEPVANLAGWRTPALTGLWTLLFRSGHEIVVAFILVAAATLPLGYLTAARLSDPTTALVVPALLIPYYLAALASLHFLSYEIWASFFAIAALALVTLRRDKAGLALVIGAAAIREWFVSAFVGGIIGHVRHRHWRSAGLWSGALVLVLAFYAINIWHARDYLLSLGIHPSSGSEGRLGKGGPLFVLYTLQFNARFFAQVYVVPYLVFLFGLVGCAALIRRGETFLPSLVLVPVAFFLFTGSGLHPGDPYGMDVYYSGAFLPFAMIAACCAGQLFRPGTTGGGASPPGQAHATSAPETGGLDSAVGPIKEGLPAKATVPSSELHLVRGGNTRRTLGRRG